MFHISLDNPLNNGIFVFFLTHTRDMMFFFGNCLFCAVVLWLRYGGKIIMSYRPGTHVPHWMVLDRSGSLRHFRVVRNIMPWPLCYVLFIGRFESLGGTEQSAYIQPQEERLLETE